MPRIRFSQLLKQTANAANLAVRTLRNEFNSNSRTYIESRLNDDGRFGGVTRHFVHTANISLPLTASGVTVANLENLIPAPSYVTAVTVRVLSAIGGPPGFHVSDASSINLFANSVTTSVNSISAMATSNALVAFPVLYRTASNVTIRSNTATAFNGGNVRVAVHGILFDPPSA